MFEFRMFNDYTLQITIAYKHPHMQEKRDYTNLSNNKTIVWDLDRTLIDCVEKVRSI